MPTSTEPPEEPEWDVRHPAYKAGLQEGREQGAKHMRTSIESLLKSYSIDHPGLPRTMGERRAFEKRWDAQVAAGEADIGPKHNHMTRDIKPLGQCPACDRYWNREKETGG